MRTILLDQLRKVTENSALACSRWIGRGNKEATDSAAVECMRDHIKVLGISARILVGEGEKDNAPLLYRDECFGSGYMGWVMSACW